MEEYKLAFSAMPQILRHTGKSHTDTAGTACTAVYHEPGFFHSYASAVGSAGKISVRYLSDKQEKQTFGQAWYVRIRISGKNHHFKQQDFPSCCFLFPLTSAKRFDIIIPAIHIF
ncbi:MAG: hypothetical protein IJ480_00745 [Clostridia bacterium]|nr:hypothetical protein [Clostridia bacterium]